MSLPALLNVVSLALSFPAISLIFSTYVMYVMGMEKNKLGRYISRVPCHATNINMERDAEIPLSK